MAVKAITGESRRESSVDALSSHLASIGVTVESKEHTKGFSGFIGGCVCGSVRITNRNIDEVLLDEAKSERREVYRCSYLVHAGVKGLEQKLTATLKLIRKGLLLKEVVDFRWEGQELAQMLNNDPLLREHGQDLIKGENYGSKPEPYGPFLSKLDSYLRREFFFRQFPGSVSIMYYKNGTCVRITPRQFLIPIQNAFPSVKTFEVYDRIAGYVRSIASC